MQLRIGKIFDVDGLTDNEKLFCWVMTKMMKRYGWLETYHLDTFDYKILLHSNPIAHSTHGALGPRIPEMFKIGFLTDRQMRVELTKELKQRAETYHKSKGQVAVGTYEVEVTNPKVIQSYTYLVGILGYMTQWINEENQPNTEGMTTTEAMRAGRMTDPFELQQLLNALD